MKILSLISILSICFALSSCAGKEVKTIEDPNDGVNEKYKD